MRMSDLDFELPPERIATHPVEPRDASRLLVCSRTDPGLVEHARFADLPRFLGAEDILTLNRTRVVPARIRGSKKDTNGRVGGLFLHESGPGLWRVLLHSNGRLLPGTEVILGRAEEAARWSLILQERVEEGWLAALRRDSEPATDAAASVLEQVGATPLPPYILGARRQRGDAEDDARDSEAYQTVYADPGRAGSVAAPTAGLHFTPELLGSLESMGVRRGEVTLHVGMGTFKPVTAERLEDHQMHSEWIDVPGATLAGIRSARERGGRSICVGTTSVRALESLPRDVGDGGYSGATELMIRPGFEFRWTDGLITNFHLPRSTLLALVAALFPEGVERVLALYREAIEREYRFFSYGDAMLILD